MFRVLELVGLLAPGLGVVLLVLHRRRAPRSAPWGIAGAVLGLAGSAIGVVGRRLAVIGGGDGAGFFEQLDRWTLARFALLALALLVLIHAVRSHRDGVRSPAALALMIGGVVLALLGAALQFVPLDLGRDHEEAAEILGMLVETIEFALLGAGVFALSLAVVTGRGAAEGQREPVEAVLRSVGHAHRMYRHLHGRR